MFNERSFVTEIVRLSALLVKEFYVQELNVHLYSIDSLRIPNNVFISTLSQLSVLSPPS